MRYKKTLLVLLLVFFQTAWANFAEETPSLNRKVRNLGVGNVGVAIRGTHGSSPFYNPAGLNDLEEGEFEFLTFTADVSKNSIDLISDIRDFADDLDDADSDADKIRAFNSFVQSQVGEFQHMRLSINLVNFAKKNFAAGLLIDQKLDLAVREEGLNEFQVRNLTDLAAYFSGAYDFWDKMLQVGITVKPTVRLSLDEQDQAITISDALNENSDGDSLVIEKFEKIKDEQRFGLGVDLGLKSNLAFDFWKDLKVYKMLKPSAGLTWQDIGSPSFGNAPANTQSVNAGVAIHPDVWKLKNTVGLDIRNINQERPFLSKLHFGVESELPWVLSARAGVSQGYLTAGATIDLWFFKIDGAIYFEEVARFGREDGNLRWAVQLGFKI